MLIKHPWKTTGMRRPPDPFDGASAPALLQTHGTVQTEDSLEVWGYMPGHVHKQVVAIECASVLVFWLTKLRSYLLDCSV